MVNVISCKHGKTQHTNSTSFSSWTWKQHLQLWEVMKKILMETLTRRIKDKKGLGRASMDLPDANCA